MVETLHTLITQLEEAAETLQDLQAQELTWAARDLSGTVKLQILVLGITGSGRSSLVNAILRRPVLAQSPLPKIPVPILLRYGSSDVVESIAVDGVRTALPAAKLRSLLTGPAASSAPPAAVEVQAPCDLLQMCDLRIEALDAVRSPEEWRELLAGHDFTMLVLNAGALLSHVEREFVRTQLAEGYGLQRVAIAVNQMDLVPEEERASILELVHTFLGPFDSRPAVLDLSALQMMREPASSESARTLDTLLDDLVERRSAVREDALRQALEAALDEMAAGVARQGAMLALGQAEVARARETMVRRTEWLQGRIERTKRRVVTFVGTLLRDEFLQETEAFGQVVRRRLPEEITRVEDISAIRRHLPGYIETIWMGFLNAQRIALRHRLIDEAVTVNRMIKADLEEMLGADLPHVGSMLQSFDLGSQAMRSFVMPKRGKHRAVNVARGLSLHGFVMLIFNPPLGVLSLAAGHAVRWKYRGEIETSEKEAISGAAVAAARDVEREVHDHVAEQLSALAGQLQTEVIALYDAGLETIEQYLDECEQRDQGATERRELLRILGAETIPALRRALLSIDRGDAA